MATADFFDTAAELGSEEDDEDFDEDAEAPRTKTRRTNGADMDDSSEEDDDDDDEEAARQVKDIATYIAHHP